MIKLFNELFAWLVIGGVAAYQLLTTGRINRVKIADQTIGIGKKLQAWANKRSAD